MRQVSTPIIDDAKIYDQVTAAKRQPRRGQLLAARDAVIEAYDNFSASVPDVAHLPAVVLAIEQRRALLHAYRVETKPFARLKRQLTEPVILARCPFCCIGEASTLDHYLPKELHPQFAIYSGNLVPCCSPCNTRKSQLVLDDKTEIRLFLHPYFDPIPDEQFIKLNVSILPNALGLAFRTYQPAGLAEAAYLQLKSHFRLLRLADRYRIMSLEHLRNERRSFRRFYGPHNDTDRVSFELLQNAEDWEEDFGPNHWRVVLYRGLAADIAFCDGGFEVLEQIV